MSNANSGDADVQRPDLNTEKIDHIEWHNVVETGGCLRAVDHYGSEQLICDDRGRPISRFQQGWSARGLLRLGNAGALIDLVHAEGAAATWVLDGGYRFVAEGPWFSRKAARSPKWKELSPLFSQVLDPLTDAMLRDPLELVNNSGFLALQQLTLSSRVGLLRSRVPTPLSALTLQAADASGTCAVLADRLHELFQLDWVARTRAMFRTNKLSIPALTMPGDAWRVGIIRLNLGTCLLHIQDAPGQPTWVASLNAGKWMTRGGLRWVLLPDGRTVVSPSSSASVQADEEFKWLLAYYAAAGQAIGPWFSEPAGPALAYRPANGNHLGHLVWNDLSGAHDLLGECGEHGQSMVVYDLSVSPGADIYGPFGQLFPELAGNIRRPPQPDDMLNVNTFVAATREKRHLVNFRLAEVRTALRERILRSISVDTVARAITPLAPLRLKRSLQSSRRPAIALGLRLQNRTSPEMLSFYEQIVRHLCTTCAPEGLGVVVDGMNILPNGQPGDPTAKIDPTSQISREVAFVDELRDRLSDLPVDLISCVGMTIAENLVWLNQVDMFVAPQGGGLAKYRWVHNIPGYVLTSAINLQLSGRVYLYSHKGRTESPAPLICNSADDVTDLFPLDDRGVPIVKFEGSGGLSSVNFHITNPNRILEQIERMFRSIIS